MPGRSLEGAAALALLLAVSARTTARGADKGAGSFPGIGDHFKYGSVGTEERAGLLDPVVRDAILEYPKTR